MNNVQSGIYPTLDIEAYHRSPGISKTGLVKLDEAAAVYRYAIDHLGDESESKALRIGKALHCKMEGTFEHLYIDGPDAARNTKIWKEFESSHPNKVCLQPDEVEAVENMKKAVDAYRPAQTILSQPGRNEVSFYWIDPRTGCLCKCRPDWVSADLKTVVDFKTAREVLHHEFQSDAYKHRYFVSAAMTIDGIYRTTGIKPERYIFLAVRSTPVHLVATYDATADEIALGRGFIRRNLSFLRRCQASGSWPGLPEEILPLGLPRFAPKPAAEDYEIDERMADEELIAQLEREFENVASGF
ncbi:PD-(D/E)XK nuclease-like domain-containing protein [Oligoflexus tunisiensis]|uniref:PD-(D/E)XK nuclease-like domain-containing protein n=1 Tax=Oligoflexus tunisiensis TaxID=708132 RepID=UPI00114C916E|nr:PD-(D/E)XK nuclease-like domain-containing protein [Oligoflexus tunisiensis]